MFPVKEREGEVNKDSHPFGRIPPDEVHPQHLLRPGESDGPLLIAVHELFGGDIPVQISSHRFRHDEREDVRVPPVWDFREAVQQRHPGS